MAYEEIHPLVYFWLAFYKDGTCFPQFDFETGKENKFADIDQEKLDKFGVFPFNAPLAIRSNMAAGKSVTRVVENIPFHIMKLGKGQRLIYVRRNFIHVYTYSHCDKCGFEWQWIPDRKEGEKTEFGMDIYPDFIMQKWQGKDYPLCQCPKCKSFDPILCPVCGTLINKMRNEKEAVGSPKEFYYECPKCKQEYPWDVKMLEGSVRRLVYIMGHQKTIEGRNIKNLMFIFEDGSFELDEDFNHK
jgi:hypothetical protein